MIIEQQSMHGAIHGIFDSVGEIAVTEEQESSKLHQLNSNRLHKDDT